MFRVSGGPIARHQFVEMVLLLQNIARQTKVEGALHLDYFPIIMRQKQGRQPVAAALLPCLGRSWLHEIQSQDLQSPIMIHGGKLICPFFNNQSTRQAVVMVSVALLLSRHLMKEPELSRTPVDRRSPPKMKHKALYRRVPIVLPFN